ncbi:MAG: SulP family inorganic anion transporter [Nanoarchaeota archaeon]
MHYSLDNLKGDLIAGTTAALVALPLALAFGIASGLGPGAGLLGAIIAGFIASMFGGTPLQITGPTAPMTILVATIVASHGAGIALLTIAFAGLFQIAFGILKLGKLIEYLPRPVVSGFMTGIALLIIIEQLKKFIPTGYLAVLVMTSCALFLILWSRFSFPVPGAIVIVVASIIWSFFIGTPLTAIGEIPPINFEIFFPLNFSLEVILLPAISLAVLGSIDTLLTSVIVDRMAGTRHSSNKELIGQGLGNTAAGLLGGLAGAGATIRTIINVRSGASSRLSSTVHSIILLLIALFFTSFFKHIYLAVLGGILLYVGITIIDYIALKNIKNVPLSDALIFFSTTVMTVVFNLVVAVIIGVLIASILFIKRMTELSFKQVSVESQLPPRKRAFAEKLSKKLAIYQLSGPLFFGAVSSFEKELSKVYLPEYILLKLFGVISVDESGALALNDFIKDAKKKGCTILICGIQEEPKRVMDKLGVLKTLGYANIFDKPLAAIMFVKKR